MAVRYETQGLTLSRVLGAGAIAGLAGGLAEVVFMGAYSAATGMSSAEILKLITLTFFESSIAFGPNGLWAGLLIHFVLSLAIGLSFGAFARIALKGSFSYSKALVWGSLALTAIWACNFFVILPVYNAAFIELVHPAPAFFSKLSFGIVLALGVRLACSAPEAAHLVSAARAAEGV